MKLDGSVSAVVTGGASGLGEGTARGLAEAGVKVAILDVNAERGEVVAKEIGGVFCKCDVTSEESATEALAKARAAHGQERILVNCAGIAIGERTARRDRETGAIIPHSMESYNRVLQINLVGSFNLITKSVAGMMATKPVTSDGGRGVIVCTASVAGQDGQIGQVAYAASKGGIMAMTLPIARDLSKEGIRICTILPGLFNTPMFNSVTEEYRKTLEASVPFPSRLGLPSEYASLVRQICENEMLNGECIRLDGAVRLAPR